MKSKDNIFLHFFILYCALGYILGLILIFYYKENYIFYSFFIFFVISLFLYKNKFLKKIQKFFIFLLFLILFFYGNFVAGRVVFEYNYIKNFKETLYFKNSKIKLLNSKKLGRKNLYIFKLEGELLELGAIKIKNPKFIFIAKDKIRPGIYKASGSFKKINNEYFDYYYSKNIFFEVVDLKIEKSLVVFKNKKLKDFLSEKVDFYIQYPYNTLVNAIILNKRDKLPWDLKEKFKSTNTYHIFAISGLHITIFLIIILGILQSFGVKKYYAIFFSILFLFFYIFIIGFPIPTIRAIIFSFMGALSYFIGKKIDFLKLVIYVGFLFLIINPGLLNFNLSFIYSFFATLGIVMFYRPLGYFLYEKLSFKNYKIFISPIIGSFSAILTTAPLNILFFGKFNLIGILANPPLLLVLPIFLFFSVLFFGFLFSEYLVIILSFLIEKSAQIILILVEFFSKFNILLPEITDKNILFFYFVFIFFIYFVLEKIRKKCLRYYLVT